jgi:hypothetical protein
MSDSTNRAINGYHMLLILSAIDKEIHHKEDKIIREFVSEHFDGHINFDEERKKIAAMSSDDYPVHFNNSMNDFYMHSSQAERNHFLDMATRLVAADKHVTHKENLYLKELYYAWEEETEE